jgi:hypothetical protein
VSYQGFPSSFAGIIAVIQSVQDPASIRHSLEVAKRVEHLFESRFREEDPAAPNRPKGYRIDFARERLAGAITELEVTRRKAVVAGACRDLLEVIDTVLAAARAARSAAPERRRESSAVGATPAAWATVPLPTERGEGVVRAIDFDDI